MTRKQAETIAYRIATILMAFEDTPEKRVGAILAAVALSDVVAEDGRMEAPAFLARCGLQPKSFRHPLKIDPQPARELASRQFPA